MEENLKQLLLKDLSARLPYHVKVKIWLKDGTTEEGALDLEHNYADVLLDTFYYNKIKDIKPFLRPMSSMIEEEKVQLSQYACIGEDLNGEFIDEVQRKDCAAYIDWLNKNHFDYRGLIEKGLAIAVTKENNSYKE